MNQIHRFIVSIEEGLSSYKTIATNEPKVKDG
jgi:hypothetical protein